MATSTATPAPAALAYLLSLTHKKTETNVNTNHVPIALSILSTSNNNKSYSIMIQVPINEKENLYVTFTDDCEPNAGGFYCEIYNELEECIDNFVIHKEDLPNADYNEKMKIAKSLAFNYVINSLR